MINELAPIALFVYNRPEHTRKTLDALAKNILADKSRIYIFSDGPKTETDVSKVAEVRSLIKSITGFGEKIIYESETNKGLANSVIAGVTEVLTQHEKIIVMEDDLVSSATFLSFMNEALNVYKKEKKIYSITGYCYPISVPSSYNYDVFVFQRAASWGWGSWRDRWEKVDWDVKDFSFFRKNRSMQKRFNEGGDDLTPMLFKQMLEKIDSWAIRWDYSHFINDAYCLYPVKSTINHIGADSSGTHFKSNSKFEVEITNFNPNLNFSIPIEINNSIKIKIKKMLVLSLIRKTINFVKYGIY